MSNEQNEPSIVDGGTPTDQEALLASQVDTIGENPQEEPTVEPAAAPAAAPAPAAEAIEAAAAPVAAPAPAAVAEPAAAAPAPAPPAVVAPPTAPRDFDADLAELQRKYDDGEIEGADYQKELRTITREEGAFTARLEIWAERQQTAEQAAANEFSSAALAWEKANADFMANPLRAGQMQQALNAVFAKSPTLAPAEQFAEAAKIAFEAYGYQPKAAAADTTGADAAKAIAEAQAKRTPAGVPPTLAGSPAAGPIETSNGANPYAALDAMGIDELENAIARMSPAQQEAYLRGAPGASSLATNKAD